MHVTITKIGNAQQSRINKNYKNTKGNLLNANVAVGFSKKCRAKQLNSNYVNTRIVDTIGEWDAPPIYVTSQIT